MSRRVPLAKLRDVRAELASLYRRVDRGEVDSRDGSRRAFILRTLADVIVFTEIEQRVGQLEATAAATAADGARGYLPENTRRGTIQ